MQLKTLITGFEISRQNPSSSRSGCISARCLRHFLCATFFGMAGLLMSGCFGDSGTNSVPDEIQDEVRVSTMEQLITPFLVAQLDIPLLGLLEMVVD